MRKMYDAHIFFRNNKYDPVEIRGYCSSELLGDKMIKFNLPDSHGISYHIDDIHEIETRIHEE